MITLEQAQASVAKTEVLYGNKVVANFGFEDSEYFLLVVGHSEWLTDGDPGFQLYNDQMIFVDKESGQTLVRSAMCEDDPLVRRAQSMVQFGTFPSHMLDEPTPSVA